jgi:hypothetical protein
VCRSASAASLPVRVPISFLRAEFSFWNANLYFFQLT